MRDCRGPRRHGRSRSSEDAARHPPFTTVGVPAPGPAAFRIVRHEVDDLTGLKPPGGPSDRCGPTKTTCSDVTRCSWTTGDHRKRFRPVRSFGCALPADEQVRRRLAAVGRRRAVRRGHTVLLAATHERDTCLGPRLHRQLRYRNGLADRGCCPLARTSRTSSTPPRGTRAAGRARRRTRLLGDEQAQGPVAPTRSVERSPSRRITGPGAARSNCPLP